MATIDPKGLFFGDRLAACSDAAQNWWPRLFLASNGYGRIELNYPNLVSQCFAGYKKRPTEEQLWDVFADYAKHFLAVIYESDSAWWAQFATSDKYLPNYKTRSDDMSPCPPEELVEMARIGHVEWKKAKSHSVNVSERFSDIFKTSQMFKNISPIEERRGEELVKRKENATSKLLASAPPREMALGVEGTEKPFMELPALRGVFAVTASGVEAWERLYPAVDVPQQIRNMRGWLDANPRKRKTLGGMPNFINRWLQKEQDRGGSPASKQAIPQLRGVTLEEAMQR